MKQILLSLLVSFWITSVQAADASLFSVVWKKQLHTLLENNAVLANLDDDPAMEVLVAGREILVALDNDGSELWSFQNEGRFMMSPAVLTVGKDPYIYVADKLGYLLCLDRHKNVCWKQKLTGPALWTFPVAQDIDGDGKPELIQGDTAGTISIFDAVTGKLRCTGKVNGEPSKAAVADLDGKPGSELVYITTQGEVAALHSNGTPYWTFAMGATTESWGSSSPVVFTSSKGDKRILAASGDGSLFCLRADGSLLWKQTVESAIASSLSVGAMDDPATPSLFAISQLGVVYRFDEEGNRRWQIDMQSRSLSAGTTCDVNNDGRPEYLFSTQNGHLQVIDNSGSALYDHFFGHRTINCVPIFGSVSRLNRDEMIVTGGESGWVYCLSLNKGALKAAQNSPKERKNRDLVTMAPRSLSSSSLFVGQTVWFDYTNRMQETAPLVAEVTCTAPDGSVVATSVKAIGKEGSIYVTPSVGQTGDYRFCWQLRTADGVPLVKEQSTVAMKGVENDLAFVDRTVEALERQSRQSSMDNYPSEQRALHQSGERLKLLRSSLVDASTKKTFPSLAVEQVMSLTREARRADNQLRAVAHLVDGQHNRALLAFEGMQWENRNKPDEFPQQFPDSLVLVRQSVPGENEQLSVQFYNPGADERVSRVVVGQLPQGIGLELSRSVPVTNALGDRSWDVLARLDETSSLTVPSLQSSELWIKIKLSPDCRPGKYRLPLSVRSIVYKGAVKTNLPVTSVTVELEVLPFRMAGEGDFRLCCWAQYSPAYIKDLLAHGNTIFIAPYGAPLYDANHKLTGVDFSATDAVVNCLAGRDVFVLLSGIPEILSGKESTENVAGFLARHVDYLASKGIDKKHFALYSIDEPGVQGMATINDYIEFGKRIREADPTILLYQDGDAELPPTQAMAPYSDIWTPYILHLAEQNEVMKTVRKDAGANLWTYDCVYPFSRPIGAKNKTTNLVGQYRLAASQAFSFGASAIGYWCYNYGIDDMWNTPLVEYPMVYGGTSGPIPSRRWEAVSEGMEDVRILIQLKRLAADTQNPLSPQAKAKIAHLLEVTLKEYSEKCFEELRLGVGRVFIDQTNSQELLNRLRAEMMECAGAL